MTDSSDKPKDVLSFFVTVSTLPKAGMPVRFEATQKECAIVAALLEIPAIEKLTADLSVKGWRGGGAKVTGTLAADVVQTDVVTLDPLHQKVQEEVDLVFVPENSRLARLPQPEDGELHLDPEGDDIPETFSGDQIDLGLVLTEILALGLDPYPRGQGASFDEFDTDPEPDVGRVSPFAALARLKPDRT